MLEPANGKKAVALYADEMADSKALALEASSRALAQEALAPPVQISAALACASVLAELIELRKDWTALGSWMVGFRPKSALSVSGV